MSGGGRGGRPWTRLRARVLAYHEPVCSLCGEWIDLELDGRHPWGPSVDHILPVSEGGADSWDNLLPAHNRCNAAKSNRRRAAGFGGDRPYLGRQSRDW